MVILHFPSQLQAGAGLSAWLSSSQAIYFVAPLVLLVALVAYRTWFHPLARVPGPPLAAVTGLWRNICYLRGTWHDDVLEIHRRYGRVVRVAPNEVSVVDALAMKQLYGHGTSAQKTDWYHVWQVPNTGPAFFAETDPKLHSKLRKRVSAAYTMSAILKYEPHIQTCLDLFMWKLKEFAEDEKIIDISYWVTALAFDIVGEIAYGTKFGHLKTGTDVWNMRGSISKAFYLGSILGHVWGQQKIFNNRLANGVMSLLGMEPPFKMLQDFTEKRVHSRKHGKDGASREDMLTHFVEMKSLDGTSIADDGEIVIEALNIVGAGADTTSVDMCACIYYLGMNPDAYKKLQQEIDSFYESQNLTDPISYNNAQQLSYLKAVVQESLRLFPSIMYQLLRISPGIVIDKQYIPPGYDIGISPRSQNRDRAVYGPDADDFRPERWLQSDEDTSALNRYNMTFGGNGPRTCIGKNIALVEINKLIAQMLYNFDFEFMDKQKPWQVSTFWFAHPTKMNISLKSRPGRKLRQHSE